MTSLRKNKEKAHTNLMATCRQIHEETASLVYGSKEFHVKVYDGGAISFLTHRHTKTGSTNFSALNQIQILRVEIESSDDPCSITEMQDALFAFFGHLRDNHKLHTLNIDIDIEMDRDNRYQYFSDRKLESNIECEFRHVVPGHLSRGHLTTFLADPFRTIRNLGQYKSQSEFTMTFIGDTQTLWKDIPDQIAGLVKGDSSVPNYRVFGKYFEILNELLETVRSLDSDFPRLPIEAVLLSKARIRGEIEIFKRRHRILITGIEELVEEHARFGAAVFATEKEQCEQKLYQIAALVQDLEATLPGDDVDTSILGYNKADTELKERIAPTSHKEKAGKEKRKREETNTASSKKAKVNAE